MSGTKNDPQLVDPAPDVFIAGSGPIGCTYARTILDKAEKENLRVWMVDAGAQDNPIIGRHHKNSAKYQKDIDAFVNVIKGALQRVSVPPAETYMATLGAEAWSPAPEQCLVSAFHNPDQKPELNLPGCAITRTVGGMATHWTCACPIPHPDERKNSPIADDELLKLIDEAGELLNVNSNEYDKSIRHNLVKDVLAKAYPGKSEEGIERVKNLPLAVKRNENPAYVTWSGSDTVLGKKYAEQKDDRFTLLAEHKLVGFARDGEPVIGKGESQDFDQRLRYGTGKIKFAYVKDIKNNKYLAIPAKYYIVACGAIGTPQVLWNSGFGEHDERPNMAPELPALGRYLTEQSISFCQVRLGYPPLINPGGEVREEFRQKCQKHCEHPSKDPIPIPFNDPEPQVTMPYTRATPWHTQIHRDAFSYGDVGPRADPRLIVDLRFFGKQEPERNNYVTFSGKYTDIYGMPQATFNVTRNPVDSRRDQEMMLAMCEAANKLGPFLPGSYPQFMEPGLALHITGTTRLGKVDEGQLEHPPQEVLEYSVANQYSQVHGHKNLYVGGNNVIPDSTACNPTRTSVAYALKAARNIVKDLK
ncbi:unnamed protein product [Rhizoctonia solani]|uniref:Pyranose 2-oxidase n=1 Tax=Rhizoctonia solani TaxID=456999 RepID=A0A8H3HNG4_9AGAM|nr:unnamed protein product [Rhizoctonia solani]